MGLIRRSYTYLDKNSLLYFFNALIRLHLEYYVYLILIDLFKSGGGFRTLPGVLEVDFCEND